MAAEAAAAVAASTAIVGGAPVAGNGILTGLLVIGITVAALLVIKKLKEVIGEHRSEEDKQKFNEQYHNAEEKVKKQRQSLKRPV